MTEPTEPAWTGDDGHLKTTHAGYRCSVGTARETNSWYWNSRLKHNDAMLSGWVDDLELAKACALRAAEALAVIDACKSGDPPESSGFPPQFSARDLAQARAFAEALRADMWRMWQGEWGPYDESDVDKWPLPWDGDETVVQTREGFWAPGGDRQPSAFSQLLEVTKVTQPDT